MARKKKEFPPVKERFIGFRVTEYLYQVIETEATQAKMSVSEYCRSVATNKRIIIKKEQVFNNPELLSALSNLGKIGSNLNQIARHLNEGGSMDSALNNAANKYFLMFFTLDVLLLKQSITYSI